MDIQPDLILGDNPETETVEFELPADVYREAQDKLIPLNKKAARNGIPETTARILETIEKEIQAPDLNGEWQTVGTRKFYRVEVTVTQVKIAGWNFRAKLEHLEEGNIIYSVGNEDLAEQWRTAAPDCQHCNINRQRKETYIVTSEAGETRQIGSTCIREYTGIDPAKAFKWIDYIHEVYELYQEDEDRPRLPREAHYIDTEFYLAFVTSTIRNFGWTPRSKADGLNSATADTALNIMFDARYGKEVEREYLPNRDDRKLAKDAIEYMKERDTKSDYEWNMKLAIANAVVPAKALGIVASLIPYYKRHLEYRIEAELKIDSDKECTHVGTVGTREDFILTLTKMLPLEGGQYGPTYLHKFRDQDGNIVSWFSSNLNQIIPEQADREALTEGDTYNIKATVKKHDEYQGVPQTLITRAKIQGTVKKDLTETATIG